MQDKLYRTSVLSLLALFGFTLSECCAAYPGNSNFRNVATTSTATTRNDWVTNALNNALSYSFDWSKGSQLCPGVTLVPTVLTTEAGWPRQMVCYCVRIDLTTPGLRFTGTDRCPEGWGDPMPESNSTCAQYESGHYPKRTVREKTSDFLARNRGSKSLGGKERDAVLAWNGAAWLPWQGANTNLWACPYSPLFSDGIQISNNRTGAVEVPNLTDPAPQIMFAQLKNGVSGMIPSMTEDIARQTWFCVPAFVTGLVDGKWNALDNGDVGPRTAIGISQDGKTFYLLVCDGRRDGWTAGCDFTSLSKILFGMGAWVGFNLDGGGSSTLCRWNTSTGKPEIINRTSGGLRDNGSNIAIYYKEPDAMLGNWAYDDLDFLLQDIIDGETDGSSEINVLRDATFTAEHPCIPSGRYNLWSTNNASIGWADGVTPQVAAGTIVRFRNIRFREGSRALSVAAGGTAVLFNGADLDEVDTQNSGGLVLAGSLVGPLRVNCANATQPGDVFATSSLSLSETRAQLGAISCGADDDLVAVASERNGTVVLSWDRLVDFGSTAGSIAATKDRADVSVTVSSAASDSIPPGALLKLTLTSEDGRRSAVQTVAFSGAGTYTFHTADSSDPTICGSGYSYTYTVELADANGIRIPHTETVGGRMSLGVEAPWFAADAADDSAVGGFWSVKPSISQGQFSIVEGTNECFEATETRNGRVRLTTVATVPFADAGSGVSYILSEIAAKEPKPLGAALMVEKADGTPVWCGLVSDNGVPAFRELYGPVILNAPCALVQEVDWSSGAPLVSYLASTNGTDFVRLADASGATWFDSASSASSAVGHVEFTGVGRVDSFAGTSVRRIFAPSIIKIR